MRTAAPGVSVEGWPGETAPARFFENQILTVKQTAEFLKCSRKTVYSLASRGVLPHRKLGRGIRFLQSELVEWVRKGE